MEKKINPDCPCKNDCERHGDCEACQEHHIGGLTTCKRPQQQ